ESTAETPPAPLPTLTDPTETLGPAPRENADARKAPAGPEDPAPGPPPPPFSPPAGRSGRSGCVESAPGGGEARPAVALRWPSPSPPRLGCPPSPRPRRPAAGPAAPGTRGAIPPPPPMAFGRAAAWHRRSRPPSRRPWVW